MPTRKRKQPIDDQEGDDDDVLVERKKSAAPTRIKKDTISSKERRTGREKKQDGEQEKIQVQQPQKQESVSNTRRRTRQSDPLLAPDPEPEPTPPQKKRSKIKPAEPAPSSADNTPKRSSRRRISTSKAQDTEDELIKASKPPTPRRARKAAVTDTPDQTEKTAVNNNTSVETQQLKSGPSHRRVRKAAVADIPDLQEKTNANNNTRSEKQQSIPAPSPSQVETKPKRTRTAKKVVGKKSQPNGNPEKTADKSTRLNNSRASTKKGTKTAAGKETDEKGQQQQDLQKSHSDAVVSMNNRLHDRSNSTSSASSLLEHLDDYVKLDLEVRYNNLQALYYELVEQTATDETSLNKAFASYKAMTDEKYQALEKVAKAQEKMVKKVVRERDELKGAEEMVANLQEKMNAQHEALEAALTESRSLKERLASNHKLGGSNSLTAATATIREDLLIDMSGLYIRDVKKTDSGNGSTYDILHTGGKDLTFHYKLIVPEYTSETELIDFVPLIDEERDAELISKLPDYLSEEISFQRKSLPQFYQKISRAMYS